VWISVLLQMRSLSNILAISATNSYFRTLVRSSSRLWFALFVRRWPGGANPRTIAQFSEAMGESLSFFTAFKSRFSADLHFQVVALDLSSNLGRSSSPNLSWFSARVGYAGSHLWCAGQGMNCAVGQELESGKYDRYFYGDEFEFIIEHLYYGPGEAPRGDETLAELVPSYHQWFGPQIR
jgi:hypothetical protein